MPTVLKVNGFRFHFYASDGDEPIHVHVSRGEGYAKIWLEPEVEAQYFYKFKASEIKSIMSIVKTNTDLIKKEWNDFFRN